MTKKKGTLASPFVPVEEQPYKIPDNWCWTYIGSCYGVTSSKRVHKEDWKDSGIPFYRTRELVKLSENGYVDNELFISNELYEKLVADYGKPKIGDILISGVGTIGIPFVIKENTPFYFKDGNVIWFQCKGICLPEYIFYLYKSSFMFNSIHDMSAGTTVDTYTIINANRTVFPLPPLAEQQRIVDRIESLFAKLDEAKEKTQAVVDGFELRKSAILHKAFTGELVGISGGKTVPLETIVAGIRIGPFGSALHKEDYITGGIPIVNPKHIVNQQIVSEENVTITEEKASELIAYRLKTGDIIMGRRGEMGRSAPVTEKENGWLCGTGSLIIRLQNGYSGEFYSQIIASHSSVQYLEENFVGSTMKNLNEKVIKSLPVPDYTKEQQKVIIATLNSLLEKESQAKEAAEAVLDQIDTMKKAILARAFRGELGTNDPAEEWAGELVREVLKSDAPKQPRAKAVFIPRELEMQLESELERKIVKLFLKNDSVVLPIEVLMAVSSKKFEVMDALRNLDQRRIIKKLNNGNYSLMR